MFRFFAANSLSKANFMPSVGKVSIPTGVCFAILGGMRNRSYLPGLMLNFKLSRWLVSSIFQPFKSNEVLAPGSLSRDAKRNFLSFSFETEPPCTEQTSANFRVRFSII